MAAPTSAKPRANRWVNWGGNQMCAPAEVASPASAGELSALVARAASAGLKVRAVGSGHSFTDAACTSGVQVRFDRLAGVRHVDTEHARVTVGAGTTIAALNEELASAGLALPNLGDIGYQTVSGAISTSTHGTGLRYASIAAQVVGMELVAGDGKVVRASERENPDILAAARVGVGAAGLLSEVTLQCVPAFNLHAHEAPMRVDEVLSRLEELVTGNEHFEFYWVPHTRWALTKANNRTGEARRGPGAARAFYERVLLENVAFGAACRVGRWRPSLIPRLARAVPSTGVTDFVDRSDKVFTSPRYVHFCEMEYSLPFEAAAPALRSLMAMVEERGLLVSFPVEVRFLGPDDIPLSTSTGRDNAYIAVHMYRGTPYDQYFRAVEDIMWDMGGRPHWGKLHYKDAAGLSGRYPQWSVFQDVRRRLDPAGVFANPYTDRVLGPVS